MTQAATGLLAGILGLASVALVLNTAVLQGEMAQLRRAASLDKMDYKYTIGRLAKCEAVAAVIKVKR